MKVEQARDILGVSATATEEEIKKAFRKYAMMWHPDKAGNVSNVEREERTDRMKDINSAYVCLTQGEDGQGDDFPDGFPWNMPDETGSIHIGNEVPYRMEQLFHTRMGGFGGGRRAGAFPRGAGPQPLFPMGFSFEYGTDDHSCGYHYHYDDSDDDESEEYYPTGRTSRRSCHSKNNCRTEDMEKNRQAERNLHEHQKREAERLACGKQKAAVMKLIGKLAKPTKTDITDTSISLTIDRNKKLHGQLPEGGFWELQFRLSNGRGTDKAWAPVSRCLRKTVVRVGNLTPGTSYDFRARGGYRSQLSGAEDTLGDFSVVATLQTTGTKPSKPEGKAEELETAAGPEAAKVKQEKGGKGLNGAHSKVVADPQQEEEAQVGEEAQAGEEAKKKAQREALLKAQREKEAQRDGMEVAKKRKEEAKRDAERKKAMQLTLEREAEEYQLLMAKHAHATANRKQASAGAATEPKSKKKKNKKKKANTAPEEARQATSQQWEPESQHYTPGGVAGDHTQCTFDTWDGIPEGERGQSQRPLSAEAEAIRAEAAANGLGDLGDEELQTLIEQQRAIEEECTRNHNISKQQRPPQQHQQQQRRQRQQNSSNTTANATPTSSTSSKTHTHSAAPARLGVRPVPAVAAEHRSQPPVHVGQRPADAAAGGRALRAAAGGSALRHNAAGGSGSRNGGNTLWNQQSTAAAYSQGAADCAGGSGYRGADGGEGVCQGDARRASMGMFRDSPAVAPSLDINGGNGNGNLKHVDHAYRRVSEPHAGDGAPTCLQAAVEEVVGGAHAGNNPLHSPDSGVSSQSVTSVGGLPGGSARAEPHLRHLQPPHPPPRPPLSADGPTYTDMHGHASVSATTGWHGSGGPHHHHAHHDTAASAALSAHLTDSWHPYSHHTQHTQQHVPAASMPGRPHEPSPTSFNDLEHSSNTFSHLYEGSSAYSTAAGHHSQYDQYQDYSFGSYPSQSTAATASWNAAQPPPPQWSQPEHPHPHPNHRTGPFNPLSHTGHVVNTHGEHAKQGYETGVWETQQSDPAMLRQHHSTHSAHSMTMETSQPLHVRLQEGLWADVPAPPRQPPMNPDSAAAQALGQRMHSQSRPAAHSSLFQPYSEHTHGADSWLLSSRTASNAVPEHSMLHSHAPQELSRLTAEPPLFDTPTQHTHTQTAAAVLLPEDLLDPATGLPCDSSHIEVTATGLHSPAQQMVSPVQFDTRKLSRWATQQSSHQHAPPVYPVEWI